MFDFVVG